jgi:hypothetical protein
MEKREKQLKHRNLMIVDNNHRSFINNNNSVHIGKIKLIQRR